MRAALAALALLALPALPAQACGPQTDCAVLDGSYRVHLPPGEPTGAILFAHGYRGSAAGTMRGGGLTAMADRLGVALVALDAGADDWSLPDAPSDDDARRDEAGYARAVRGDVAARFGVAPERMIVAGFSAGGMLVWNLACEAGGDFAAFVAVAGTFWRGPPEACPTRAAIWHLHGTSDAVVPIGGRPIGPTRQGDVEAVLSMVRATQGMVPAAPIPVGGLDCRRWIEKDASLHYCLHPGGHVLRADWLADIWRATFP